MRYGLWLCSLVLLSLAEVSPVLASDDLSNEGMSNTPAAATAPAAASQAPFSLPSPKTYTPPSVYTPFIPPKVITAMPNDTIVFAGDSITWLGAKPGGWVDTFNGFIQASHPGQNIHVIASGVPGNTAMDLNERFESTVLNYNPTVVVMFIGINNIWALPKKANGAPDLTAYLTTMSVLIKKAQTHPGVRSIVIMTPMLIGDLYDGQGQYDTAIDAMAQALRSASALHNLPLIDVRKEFTTAEYQFNPDDLANGILVDSGNVHPTALGAELLAGTVLMGFGD